jgi:hypothetical protein
VACCFLEWKTDTECLSACVSPVRTGQLTCTFTSRDFAMTQNPIRQHNLARALLVAALGVLIVTTLYGVSLLTQTRIVEDHSAASTFRFEVSP